MGRFCVALRPPTLWAVGVLFATSVSSLRAELYTYTITQSQSQINLTAGGSFLDGALTVTEQNPNAITRYNGTIGVDAAIGGPNFVGAGSANAVNPTGAFSIPLQYQPGTGGAAQGPANYGVLLEAPVGYDLPAIPINGVNIDLGVLQSVVAKVALRNVALEVNSLGQLPLTGTTFDAAQTSIEIIGGVADISLAARLDQNDFFTTLAIQVVLQGLASAYPDLGITVTSNLPSSYIDVGFNTSLPLTGLGTFANTTELDGTITGLGGPPGPSVLTLPVLFDVATSLAGIVDLTFKFEGSLRATATIPETSSLMLAGIAVSVVGGMIRWRRRRV